MNRSDFLRSALLAPLAALVGCEKPAPPLIETKPIATSGLAQWENLPEVPTTFTCTTSNSASVTYVACEGDGKWITFDGASAAGTYLP